jgi:hypothetical protein
LVGLAELASREDFTNIEGLFRQRVHDLERSLKDESSTEIEWNLAPIVAQCLTATRRARKRLNTYRIGMAVYGMIILLGLAYMLLRYPPRL